MTDPFHPRSPEPKELDAALARLLTPPSAGPPAPSTVRGLRKTLREERARLWCAGPIGTPLGAVLTLPRPGRIEMLLGTPLGPADDPTPTGRCLEAALKSGRQTGNHLAQLVHVPEAVGTAEAAKLGGMEWLAELQFLRTVTIPEPAKPSGHQHPSNRASHGATAVILRVKRCTPCFWRRTLTPKTARGSVGDENLKIF